jgi:hypothetical protein
MREDDMACFLEERALFARRARALGPAPVDAAALFAEIDRRAARVRGSARAARTASGIAAAAACMAIALGGAGAGVHVAGASAAEPSRADLASLGREGGEDEPMSLRIAACGAWEMGPSACVVEPRARITSPRWSAAPAACEDDVTPWSLGP